MDARSAPDLSLVVCARTEGHRLHACVTSVDRAVGRARDAGWSVDLSVVLHSANAETTSWAARSLGCGWRRVVCPDPRQSAARTAGLRETRGRHVALLDGGEMMSSGWLEAALSAARDTPYPAVWHPEAVIEFGGSYHSEQGYRLVFHPDAVAFEYDYTAMLAANPYSTGWLAPRAIVDGVPFRCEDPERGWGDVDWWWNCDVVGAGYHHRVVLETFHCRRVDRDGRPISQRPVVPGDRIGPTSLARAPLLGRPHEA